jgi:hypothetical protein
MPDTVLRPGSAALLFCCYESEHLAATEAEKQLDRSHDHRPDRVDTTVRLYPARCGRKQVPTMKIDRFDLMPRQDEDVAKYDFVRGSLLIRGLADRVSDIFYGGRHIAEHDLRGMHADLKRLWDILSAETIAGVGPADDSVGCAAAERYHFTYSDGSQVACAPALDDSVDPVPRHFRETEISHLPLSRVADRGAGEQLRASMVTVELPPHERPITSPKKGSGTRAHTRKRPLTGGAPAPAPGDVSALRARLEAHT